MDEFVFLKNPFDELGDGGIQKRCEEIAKELFYDYCIDCGTKQFRFAEIEFYYYRKGVVGKDDFADKWNTETYPRNKNAGELFFHYSGVDICFQCNYKEEPKDNDDGEFGGILIRSLLDGNNIIAGPLFCVNTMLNACKKKMPVLKKTDHKECKLDKTTRYGIKSDEQQEKDKKLFLCYFRSDLLWTKTSRSIEWDNKKCNKFNEKFRNYFNDRFEKTIVTDKFTNTVFLSDYLSKVCPMLYQSLVTALKANGVDCRILDNTNDIWCRDYMPIQVKNKRFVFYKYNPDYLQAKHNKRYITDVNNVKNVDFLRDIKIENLDLVLDGGNVVKCGNKIVMTKKVFEENKDKSKDDIIQMLTDAFQCEIVFLPWDTKEKYGHSDGIVHYAGCNRVLFTNYADFDSHFANEFRKILENHFEVITLSYDVRRKHQTSWAYINFLQVGKLVLVPQLGFPEDEQALQQIQDVMPDCQIVGIPSTEAVNKGGALNCVSWNVRFSN